MSESKGFVLQDLTGKRFGFLTVINRAPNAIQPSGQPRTMWNCKCDCGNEVTVAGSRLKRGQVSCGAKCKLKHRLVSGAKLQSGFTVIDTFLDENDIKKVAVKCDTCGYVKILSAISCQSGSFRCNCCYKKKKLSDRKKQLIGARFNHLTVLDIKYPPAESKNGAFLVECRCDCGNIVDNIQLSRLTHGRTKSCGCMRNGMIGARNLTSDHFNFKRNLQL